MQLTHALNKSQLFCALANWTRIPRIRAHAEGNDVEVWDFGFISWLLMESTEWSPNGKYRMESYNFLILRYFAILERSFSLFSFKQLQSSNELLNMHDFYLWSQISTSVRQVRVAMEVIVLMESTALLVNALLVMREHSVKEVSTCFHSWFK